METWCPKPFFSGLVEEDRSVLGCLEKVPLSTGRNLDSAIAIDVGQLKAVADGDLVNFPGAPFEFGSVFRALRVQRIAEAVAEEVEAEQRQAKDDGWIDKQAGITGHAVSALLDEGAPTGIWWLNSESEKGEDRLESHHGRNSQSRVYNDRSDRIGDKVTEHNSPL